MIDADSQTVLIVDDVPINIDLLCEILKDDYKLKVALNGRQALEIVNSDQPPDIVLLDVMMPEMDGYEACKRMKEGSRSRGIPVIFVTAKGDDQDETYGFELGAVDYITKPFTPAIVQARVRTHLSLHNQNKELERMVAARTSELYATRLEIIHRLGTAAEFKDNETGRHIERMSRYCHVLALALGMPEKEADLLLNAAPMHDIGKIGIPDNILSKPGKLDPDEWEVMKTHTTIGATIIGNHDYELMAMARTVVLTHHERWDGAGYPFGLAQGDIPIEGRIAAVADVYDALTSKRPYKDPWPQTKAFEYIMNNSGKHFDPAVVAIFEREYDTILTIHNELSPAEDD